MTDADERARWLRLRFADSAREARFTRELARAARMPFRFGWLLAFAIVGSVAFIDPIATPADVVGPMREARALIVMPLLAALAAFSFAPERMFVRYWRRVGVLGVMVATGVAPGFGALALVATHRLEPTFVLYGTIALAIATITMHAVFALEFVVVTTTTAIVTVVFLVILAFGHIGRWFAFAAYWALAAQALGMMTSYVLESFRRRDFVMRELVERERARSESLVRNMRPEMIAERLKTDVSHIADGFSDVTILFADIVGFTQLSSRLSPAEVVATAPATRPRPCKRRRSS